MEQPTMYLDQYKLTGSTAFITGGGRGIGLAGAEALAEAGARVIISDLSQALLDSGRAALAAKGYDAETVLLDVTRPADVTRVADEVNATHGPVDILVANAGIALADTGGEEMPDEAWLRVIDVNLNGAFWSCRAFARHMLPRGRGAIVTIGSMSGFISNKPQRQAHYNASKAAVHHMTRSLAGEWAERGVRVNAIAPTYIDTAMSHDGLVDPALNRIWMENTPMRRAGTAAEIASVILFLSSNASSLLTGSIVLADAGYSIW
jgi:NAD(P)-dependent dehydrogenase (short-subunit alcohol dehydrogenase family)